MPKNHTLDPLRLPASRRPIPTRTRIRTLRVPLAAYVVFLLLLPVAVIATARATGWWVTTGHIVPATALGAPKIDNGAGLGNGNGTGEGTGTGQTGQEAGAAPGTDAGSGGGNRPTTIISAQDVRGSMTVQEVLDAFPTVTAAEICELFGVSSSTPTATQLKTLAQKGNGYEVTDLREWLETAADR